jgi:hypothetical protein
VKAKRQAGKLTLGEMGYNITVTSCMNAGGQFIPPSIIHPHQKMNAQLITDVPVNNKVLLSLMFR